MMTRRRFLGDIWRSMAPTKVVAFSWKLLLDRIPSKWNLQKRNVLPLDISIWCVLCGIDLKTSKHLFLHWESIMRWVETSFISPPNLFINWDCWMIIWHATIWGIWRVRNNVIFKEEVLDVELIVEDIKVLSWRWVLNRLHIPTCLYYE